MTKHDFHEGQIVVLDGDLDHLVIIRSIGQTLAMVQCINTEAFVNTGRLSALPANVHIGRDYGEPS